MAWEGRNIFNKRFNSELNHEDAYVSGYFGISFIIKSEILQAINKSADSEAGANLKTWDASNGPKMLSTLCEGVTTVPGGTLNNVDITSMGGAKWGAPGSVDFGDQITLKFRELSGMPVRKFITGWTNLVRNSNMGISELHSGSPIAPMDYTKTNFESELLYWTLKPNGKTVEFAASYHGIYSMSDLSSQITTDYETVDGQTFDVNFHVDDMRWDYRTVATCQGLVDQFYSNAESAYYNHAG